MLIQLIGSRKFLIMASILIVGVFFRAISFINGLEFVDLIKTSAVAFFACNVGSNLIGAITNKVKEKIEKKVLTEEKVND